MDCPRKAGTLPFNCRRCLPVVHPTLSFLSKYSRYRPSLDIQPSYIMPERSSSQEEDVASAVESLKKAKKRIAELPADTAQKKRNIAEAKRDLDEALTNFKEAKEKQENGTNDGSEA